MKKFIYLCGMMLIGVNIIAQTPPLRQLEDSLYCDWKCKKLNVKYKNDIAAIAPGWRYDSVYSDEFDGSTVDGGKWTILNNAWHSGKPNVGYINDTNTISIDTGYLFLNVITNDDSIVCTCTWDTTELKSHAPQLLSGWIQSVNKLQYGYIETKCYLPKNHNYWPCFWTTGRYQPNEYYDDYDEVDVFERTHNQGTNYPNILRQNCYNGIGCKYTQSSQITQILTFQDSITGKDFVFGAEILPEEVVFYVNGHVTSHLVFNEDPLKFNKWNTFTCTDIEEMIHMRLILSLTCDGDQTSIPMPHQPSWFDYVRCYKLDRGTLNTYHPTVYSVSEESTKVYPHVILGGTGCTAVINSPSAVWAEQDIVLDKGFELAPNTSFSARVIKIPNADDSELYKQNCHQPTKKLKP